MHTRGSPLTVNDRKEMENWGFFSTLGGDRLGRSRTGGRTSNPGFNTSFFFFSSDKRDKFAFASDDAELSGVARLFYYYYYFLIKGMT